MSITIDKISAEYIKTNVTNDGNDGNDILSEKEISRRSLPKDSYLSNVGLYSMNCAKDAKCIDAPNATCLGAPLSYSTISLDLIPKSMLHNNVSVSNYHKN